MTEEEFQKRINDAVDVKLAEHSLFRKALSKTSALWGSLIVAVFLGGIGYAAITLTTFTDGTTISASEVNANFQALKTAVDSLPNWIQGTTTTDAVYNEGNVGIGTTSPLATLDVNGTAKLKINSVQPRTCDATIGGTLALTSSFRMCICNSINWITVNTGATCTW